MLLLPNLIVLALLPLGAKLKIKVLFVECKMATMPLSPTGTLTNFLSWQP